MHHTDSNDPTAAAPFPRALAPALLTLLLCACGTGSTQIDGVGTPPTGEAPVAERPAGGGTGADADRDPGPEPEIGEAIAIGTGDDVDTNDGNGADTGGGDTIVVTGPVGCDAPAADIQRRALELINAVRAEARSCGTARFPAVDALGWDTRLEDASRTHSADMAATGNFDHTGTDGSSAGDRIERAGYTWGEYAENIAAGQGSLEEAMAGWIDSPGHCRNLMKPGVSDTAVACVSNEDARFRRYWTQVLARPFESRSRP